jgi:hypothetical protein
MPLSKKELQALTNLGDQIKCSLASVVEVLPADVNTIRGMGTFLNYNNSNCQRVLKTINHEGDGLSVIGFIPGTSALNDFMLKAKPYIEDKEYQQATQSIKSLAVLIKQSFGSHAKLKKLISADELEQKKIPVIPALVKRQDFFNSAKQLLGTSVDELFSGHILSENTQDKSFLHEIVMISKLGVYREEKSAPCVLFYTHPQPDNFNKPSVITQSSIVQNNEFQIGIVNEYSTANLLDFYANFSPSNLGLVFNDIPDKNPFDATFLFSNPDEISNPLVEKSACSSTFISIKSPTKKLTMAVFLERKIDLRSSVNIGCYHSTEKVENKVLRDSDAWTEHLPSVPDLKIVNLDSPMARASLSPKIIEYTNYMFNYAQLERQDFSCYLMEVDYPIWSSTYRIYFDHC